MKFRSRVVSVFLVVCLLLNLAPGVVLATDNGSSFDDVAPDAWYSEAVAFVYEHSLMTGTSSSTFEPNTTTSRGMIVTTLWRKAGSPTVSDEVTYSDVADTVYYAQAVQWAYREGVANGYDDGTFGPDIPITREQLATMFYRYAGEPDTADDSAWEAYGDSDQVDNYALDAMRWAVSEGLLTGTDSGLEPHGNATRAQVAMILMRLVLYLENVEDAKEDKPASGGHHSGGGSSGGSSGGNTDPEPPAEQEGGAYAITGLEITGNTATVTVTTNEACTLRLQLIDENNESSVKTYTVSVPAGVLSQPSTIEIEAGLDLSGHLVKCDLLDSSGAKLCNTYTSLRYTSKYQQFESKTPNDPEFTGDIVIPIASDTSQTGGFAVLAEGAKKIPVSETANSLVSISGNIYTFQTINAAQFQALQPGDLLYLPGAPTEFSLIKVASVSLPGNGTAVVAAQQDCTLSDFYQYLNIDTTVYAKASQQEGQQQLQAASIQYAAPNGDDSDIDIDKNPSVELSTKPINWGPLSMGGKGTVSARIRIVYDAETFGEDYFEFEGSLTTKFEPSITLTDKCSDKDVAAAIGADELSIPLYQGPLAVRVPKLSVNADVKFPVRFSLEAAATCKATLESTNGFLYKTTDGYQPIRTCEKEVDLDVRGSGNISFSFSAGANVKFLDNLLKAEASGELGVSVTGQVKAGDGDLTGAPSRHACLLCLDAKANLFADASISIAYKITDTVKGDLGKIKLPLLNYPLDDLYCSLENSTDSMFHGEIHSGSGKCPNYMYRATFETKDNNGDAVDGVEVTIHKDDGTYYSKVASPGSIYCYPGKYKASATIAKNPAEVPFEVKSSPCTVTLQGKNGTLEGTITDGRTSTPISGAAITVLEGSEVIASCSSNAQGAYLTSVPTGTYTLRVSASGYKVAERTFTIERRQTVHVSLEPEQEGTGTLFGTITNSKTGQPVSGVTVEAVLEEEVVGTATTAEDGSYTMALPAGAYTVAFRREGYASQQITVTMKQDEGTQQHVQLEPIFGSLKVTVIAGDTAQPLEGASVEMEQKDGQNTFSGSTGADGVCDFASLPAGDYTLRITAEKYAPYLADISVAGGSALEQNVTMYIGGTCGPTLYWKLANKVLTIYGEGEMYDYNDGFAPWSTLYGNGQLEEIIVEKGTTTLGNYAFQYARATSVSLPSTLRQIGNGAFKGCSHLTRIDLPTSVTSIGDRAFMECTELEAFDWPGIITSIPNDAFNDCSSLTTFTIPDTVEAIGDGAFCNCSGLLQIDIPGSVTSIGDNAFRNCYHMESATFHSGLQRIGSSAFYTCSRLVSANIPDTVTEIGSNAFNSCYDMAQITLSSRLTKIEDGAFTNCRKVQHITVPSGVTELGAGAFSNVNSLQSVDLPEGLRIIGANAFTNTDLTSIKIPSTVETIGDSAFWNCKNLTGSLTLPASVTSIGQMAFFDTNLSQVHITSAASSIGRMAFFSWKEGGIVSLISYAGTMEQFNAATGRGASNSDEYLGLTGKTIQCTDGNIVIPPKETT